MALITSEQTEAETSQENQPAIMTHDKKLVYQSGLVWSPKLPDTMVVCCSDGRLQMSIDDFLHKHLGVFYYDRLYAPGGPGALSEIGAQFMRTDHYRKDLQFLLEAHSFSNVVLIFHGAAEDGPSDSTCAHYRTMMPGSSRDEINERQHNDMENVTKYLHDLRNEIQVKAFRAEVTSAEHMQFVGL